MRRRSFDGAADAGRNPEDFRRMRTLVFLAVNASYSHTNLAEWYLRESAADAGWQWHTVEAALADDLLAVTGRVVSLQPSVIAASVYVFNRAFVTAVLRRCKALASDVVTIGGGPEFLGDNAAALAPPGCFNAVIRGEGESAFAALLRQIDTRRAWAQIPGVCFVARGRYRDGGLAEPIQPLDAIPSPFARRLTDFRKPFVQFETSRGCANTCAFCASGSGGKVRRFSPARVRADLTVIRAAGVRQVRLVDRTFNDHPRRCTELLRMFREEFADLKFHLEIDPARASPAIRDALALAPPGQLHLEIGIQTLNDKTYRKIRRQATARRALAGAQRLCALPNVATHLDLIAGLPGARLDDVRADLRRLAVLRPQAIQLELLKVLPGTALDRDRRQWQVVAASEPPYEVLQTPEMPHRDVQRARGLSRLVDWFYNAPPLQDIAITASAAIPDFWDRLLDFVMERHLVPSAPSLENRFRLLDRFCGAIGSPLQHRVRYQWFKHGFSATHGLCPAARWKRPRPAEAVLVEGDPGATGVRSVAVTLDADYLFIYAGGEGVGRTACTVWRLPDRNRT
jgi:radical SAM superfamily enzyme YgiQ (UPF0313 family)